MTELASGIGKTRDRSSNFTVYPESLVDSWVGGQLCPKQPSLISAPRLWLYVSNFGC